MLPRHQNINPINDVGVNKAYGYDDSHTLALNTGLTFINEHSMTAQKYIDELTGFEKTIFKHLFAGKMSKSMYRMYEFKKQPQE